MYIKSWEPLGDLLPYLDLRKESFTKFSLILLNIRLSGLKKSIKNNFQNFTDQETEAQRLLMATKICSKMLSGIKTEILDAE